MSFFGFFNLTVIHGLPSAHFLCAYKKPFKYSGHAFCWLTGWCRLVSTMANSRIAAAMRKRDSRRCCRRAYHTHNRRWYSCPRHSDPCRTGDGIVSLKGADEACGSPDRRAWERSSKSDSVKTAAWCPVHLCRPLVIILIYGGQRAGDQGFKGHYHPDGTGTDSHFCPELPMKSVRRTAEPVDKEIQVQYMVFFEEPENKAWPQVLVKHKVGNK